MVFLRAVPLARGRGVRCMSSVPRAPYDILFCGSDAFACTALEAIAARRDLYASLHVLTPPDVQHRWGAKHMRVSPVRQWAQKHQFAHASVPYEGLHAYTLPPSVLASEAPLLVTVSFGHRIPSSLLQHFRLPSLTLNLHPSMLPDLRGAAPLQWAIARGYAHTGITVQQLHPTHFDRGGILKQTQVHIPTGSTYATLAQGIAPVAANLLVDVISDLPACDARVQLQDSHGTRAPKLAPRFSHIQWHAWDAKTIDARLRAFGYAQPLTTTLVPASNAFPPIPCSIHEGRVLDAPSFGTPGQACFLPDQQVLALQTTSGVYGATRLQARGKPARTAPEWWRGFKDRANQEGRLQFAT